MLLLKTNHNFITEFMSNSESDNNGKSQPENDGRESLKATSREERLYPLNEYCSFIPFGYQYMFEVNSLRELLNESERSRDLKRVQIRLESKGVSKMRGVQGLYALHYIEIIGRLNILTGIAESRHISFNRRHEIIQEMVRLKERFYDFERSLDADGQTKQIERNAFGSLTRNTMMNTRNIVEDAFKAKLKGDRQIWKDFSERIK